MKNKNLKEKSPILSSVKNLPWKLYLSVFLTNLLPTLYLTLRIYFLGDLPNAWGVNIASQLVWISLILEVIQEGLILPLFYIIGKTVQNRQETINKVKSGLIFTVCIHLLILIIVGIFAKFFVELMAQDPLLIASTIEYIRLELIALLLRSIFKFMFILFILYSKRKTIYILLIVQMVCSVLLDTLFISSLPVSLNLGVNGIAFSNIITFFILVIITIRSTLKEFDIKKHELREKTNYTWFKEWGKVGGYSAVDSFIRNLFYMIFIIRMMNVIAEQGTYWVANNFIWTWLLLPVYPLTDIVKQSIATTSPKKLTGIMKPYYLVCTGVIFLWGITMPGWSWFFSTVLNVDNAQVVFRLVVILLPAYISFVYNTVADALFYAIGKTESLAIQTIITNVVVYGTAFVLFQMNIFVPTLDSIAILFSIGIVVDTILTFILLKYYIDKYEETVKHKTM
ncbi:MATE family Na+-driven efflux transporter [Promethearchaeum syntrophicum]|uniref:MATE family Na+-driven efflux transporter n=1 Tax=Promethearchaeum syntrophicum TaxID=2594042 RepID=A0A5B9DDJ4_9ARCH|nr:MATE family Na+-driven efflux transporter [Candidatus Prometheoarchaeum syntrophicum]QEE17192.1 hypothetical protein DSAG12_03024 [Candidatus Prometheoarchaeum syntrophicum]